MADLYINSETVDTILQNISSIDEVMETARNVIQGGGRIIIQQDYINAQPDIEKAIVSLDDLELWRTKLLGIHNYHIFK